MSFGNKPTFFYHFLFNLFIGGSTLFCRLMAFAHWLMSSLLTPLKHTWYTVGYFLWGGCDSDNSSERRTLLRPLPNKHVSSFHHRGLGCLH